MTTNIGGREKLWNQKAWIYETDKQKKKGQTPTKLFTVQDYANLPNTTTRRVIPYQFECKNQEKFATLYSFYKQGRKHGRLEPVLVCKMNDNKPLAVIDLEHFFEIIKE